MEQQQQHPPRRDGRCRILEHQGQRLTVHGWAQARNICPRTLAERLSRGWPLAKALGTPTARTYQEGIEAARARSRAWWAANGTEWRDRRIAAAAADGWDGFWDG